MLEIYKEKWIKIFKLCLIVLEILGCSSLMTIFWLFFFNFVLCIWLIEVVVNGFILKELKILFFGVCSFFFNIFLICFCDKCVIFFWRFDNLWIKIGGNKLEWVDKICLNLINILLYFFSVFWSEVVSLWFVFGECFKVKYFFILCFIVIEEMCIYFFCLLILVKNFEIGFWFFVIMLFILLCLIGLNNLKIR